MKVVPVCLGEDRDWGKLVAQIVTGEKMEEVPVRRDREEEGRVRQQLLPISQIVAIESDKLLKGFVVPLLINEEGCVQTWVERTQGEKILVCWHDRSKIPYKIKHIATLLVLEATSPQKTPG